MPALEMAQEFGTLVRWLKAEGERVQKGEPMMEIETDKAMVEIEAPSDGILSEVTAQPGDKVPVGRAIAMLFSESELRSAVRRSNSVGGTSSPSVKNEVVVAPSSPQARNVESESGRTSKRQGPVATPKA